MEQLKENYLEILFIFACGKLLIFPQWEISAAILIIALIICFKKHQEKIKKSEIDLLREEIKTLKDRVGMITVSRSL